LTPDKGHHQDDGNRLTQGCVWIAVYRDFYAGRILNINVWRERV
jgi:hypothetical protein